MKIELVIVALAAALSGCTGSNRGNTVPVFSEVSSPAQLRGYNVTNDSPARNTARNAEDKEVIKVGDTLLITFGDICASPPVFQRVKDDGTITFIFNRTFQAAGKSTGNLEKDYYVPTYFTNLAVTIQISLFVYVDGEFRNPGRYPWTNGMTLKDAIEAAGGFTKFANHRIRLYHLDGIGEKLRLSGNWFLTNNPNLKPGDRIINPRDLL
jgi:protein involved in polysaccharide export with SLBB domain